MNSVGHAISSQRCWLHLLAALIAGNCLGWGANPARSAEPVSFSVSSLELDTLTLRPPTAKELADQLNASQWCTAKPTTREPAWNELPAGAERSQWVSFVTVGFNEQASAYAFMFAGKNGAMSLAAHLPFRQVPISAYAIGWVWPMEDMLGTFRVDYARQAQAAESTPRIPLALQVIPWASEDSQPVVSTSGSNKKSSLDEARTLDPALVFEPVSIIVQGAAFEAGWAPTPGQSPWSATCEVRVEDSSCSFRLTLKGPERTEVFVKENVSWEQYHEHLVRVFRFARASQGVSDFTRLVRGKLEVLAVQDDKLAALVNQELAVFDLQSGKKLWTTEPTVKAPGYRPTKQYTIRTVSPTDVRLIRYGRSLQELDWATGAPLLTAPVSADREARFAAGPASEWVGLAAGSLALARKDKLVWEQKQPAPFTAGPLVWGELVLAGDQSGLFQARNKADGEIRWQQQLSSLLYGPLVATGKQIYVFSSEAEALLALDVGSGTELWRRPVGDVLMQTPIVVGQQLLLATKSNRLLLIEQSSGKIAQELTWPTWLVSVAVESGKSASQLAVTDLAGVVNFLTLPDLKLSRQVPMFAELAGPVLFVPDMPHRWPVVKQSEDDENLVNEIKDGPVKRGPALLVTDAEGFLSILPQSSQE